MAAIWLERCDFSLLCIDGYYDFDNDLQILLEKLE